MLTGPAVKIPIIAVFTKYDLLVNQFLSRKPKPGRRANPEEEASKSLNSSVEKLQKVWKGSASSESAIAWVKMSISKDTDGKVMRDMLTSLTNVTRSKLRDVEGELWIPWAAAQQINARQKVELSIQCVPIPHVFKCNVHELPYNKYQSVDVYLMPDQLIRTGQSGHYLCLQHQLMS